MEKSLLKLLGILLMSFAYSGSYAQQIYETARDRNQRINDNYVTNEIARNIVNVNYTDEYDQSLLMYAAANGYTNACRTLLRRGADPDLQALDGATALMYASFNGFTRTAKLLMEKGADPEIRALDGLTALMMASQNGHTAIVELLLAYDVKYDLQAYDGYTSLILASQYGQTDVVRILLDRGASVDMQDLANKTTALIQASISGFTDVVRLLLEKGANPDLQDRGGATALMTASMNGRSEVVRILLENGADINLKCLDGSNALFLASLNGHQETVRLLLSWGARPDTKDNDGTNAVVINANDELLIAIKNKLYGNLITDSLFTERLTAMVTTSKNGDMEAVELKSGKQSNTEDYDDSDKTTAFIRASRSGNIAIVKLMLKNERKMDTQRTVRFTDLMVASMNGYDEIVKLLLDKGANPGLKDNEGKTAWDYAAGNPNIRNLLEKAGYNTRN